MSKDFSIRPYIQAEGGAFSHHTREISTDLSASISNGEETKRLHSSGKIEAKEKWIPNIGLTFGAKAQKGNAYVDAGVTFGNKFKADVKAGYEINLGKEFGLDLSAHAQHYANMPSINLSRNNEVFDLRGVVNIDFPSIPPLDLEELRNILGDDLVNQLLTGNNSIDINYEEIISMLRDRLNTNTTRGESQEINASIKYDDFKASTSVKERFSSESSLGAGASVKYKKPWGQIGVGFEAGVRRSTSHVEMSSEMNSKKMTESSEYVSRDALYATPKVSAEVNLGKGFSLNGNIDSRQVEAGARLTF